MQARGTFHDGLSAGRIDLSITLDVVAGTLHLASDDGAVSEHWLLSDLLEARDHGWGRAMVVYPQGSEARLVIRGVYETGKLREAAPGLRRTVWDAGQLRRVAIWGGGAVGAMLLLLFVIIPGLADQLAHWIPAEREAAFGRGLRDQLARLLTEEDQVEAAYCSDPLADTALDDLGKTLLGGFDLPYPIEIRVLNHPMVNAFALPGGQVVLMRGLIDESATGDEVAAVLAHEIGHVVARDPTRIALRAAGSAGLLSMFFGDFAGGSVAAVLSEQLLQARYTRAAETAADDFGHDALIRNDLSPQAMAGFFERLRDEHGDVDGMAAAFLSHPRMADRIAAAEAASAGLDARPAFSEAQWSALRGMCASDGSPDS